MSDLSDILGDVIGFLDDIFLSLEKNGIDFFDYETDSKGNDISKYSLGSIAYCVKDLDEYERLKKELNNLGESLIKISTEERKQTNFKLDSPIIYFEKNISVVDLVYSKMNNYDRDGFRSACFIVDDDLNEFIKKHSKIKFDIDNISLGIKIEYTNFDVCFYKKQI